MAREIETIEQELNEDVTNLIPNASASKASEWSLWSSILAKAIWSFEKILDLFKKDIDLIISSKQPGTLYWYYDQILKFQAKRDSSDVLIVDPLEVNELGIIQYAEEDIERRLISHASIIEVDDELIIKVAKKDGDNLARLNPIDEIPAFKDYIKNIKYPGTKTRIVSTEPDLVDLQISIYFDNVFQKETVQQNVHNKMNEYRSELGFNGVIIKQRLMDKILDAEGVVSLKVNSMQASYFHPDKNQYTENQTIDVAYKLYSGYFNYKTEINIDSFIDFSTI